MADNHTPEGCSRPSKVRGAYLPVEYDLEQLVRRIDNPNPTWCAAVPLKNWNGIILDSEGRVTKIHWGARFLKGKICWQHLPSTVVLFSLQSNELSGTVGWEYLPEILQVFNLSHNKFTGKVLLDSLPLTLTELYLEHNSFEGIVDFLALREGIIVLSLSNNPYLSGQTYVSKRPKSLGFLEIFDTDILEIHE
eukprot:CAMPEP_0201491684 /NCGR_PEP_ID=MMETSP0151_2-20130828/30807_1 /ASSEMBLY_ACC=CAM_ASM_000257 /TAXON_ID=200890 /ORGANISM="Paramoeba atlantica, Strain 621/1 / CCAP 1560/9" /LENGTH=192 /DNA_ID=CAMNT_0047878159 /DNA_START=51 /DNA_END=629 /DNA_ORIENTATION=-